MSAHMDRARAWSALLDVGRASDPQAEKDPIGVLCEVVREWHPIIEHYEIKHAEEGGPVIVDSPSTQHNEIDMDGIDKKMVAGALIVVVAAAILIICLMI